MNSQFWNERYGSNASVYGDAPNVFFKDQLDLLTPGKLLLPAEGEGRNAVYAASKGWQVDAFDFSQEAISKINKHASHAGVKVNAWVMDAATTALPSNGYDAIGLVYAHLEPRVRKHLHRQCVAALKPSGIIILEAFEKGQIQHRSGGPKNVDMLYAEEELRKDFHGLRFIICSVATVGLDEGPFHQGEAKVVRLLLQKS